MSSLEETSPVDLESTQIRVLHVDDDPDIADMAATFVEREDDRFSIETTTSAKEGLERLADTEFDCIVSDYEMPGQNGIEFLETVRGEYPEIPFVLYTGKGSEEVASEAISAGVTDYLQKESGTSQYTVLANRIVNAVEQYSSKREVEASRKRLSLFFDQSPLGVIEWDEDFEVARINERANEILGYSDDDLLGESWERIVPESDSEPVAEVVNDLLEAEGGHHSINENVRKNGERIICEWHNRVVTDDAGETVAIFSQFQDITERKERERELQRYEAYLEGSTDIITVLDDTGTVTYQSPAVERILGYEADELVGTNGFEFIHPDDEDEAYESFTDLVAEPGSTVTIECRFRTADGEWRWLEVRGTNLLDHDAINGIVTNNRDITEKKKHERELEAVRRQFDAVLTNTKTPMFMKDADGEYLFVNQEYRSLFGLQDQEIIGRTDHEIHPPEMADRVRKNDQTVIKRGEHMEAEERIVVDGEERVYLSTKVPIYDTGRRSDPDEPVAVFGVATDITERKEHEQELERTTERMEFVLRSFDSGIWEYDCETERLTGYPEPCPIFGMEFDSLDGFFEKIQPVDHGHVENAVQRAVERGENAKLEVRPVEDVEAEWVEIELQPVLDDDGEVTVLTGLIRDITDQKRRETRLEALNEATRELVSADTRDEVAEIGVDAARNILGLNANAIHLYDDDQSALVPVAMTDAARELVGEPPTFTDEGSIAWRVYESGETLALDDVHEDPDIYNPESPVQSELHLPLGECGILIACSEEPEAFTHHDIVLGEVLARNVVTALKQVEQTEQLRERERELTRQNDRLEEFAGVVSHDLQNPLQVAKGRLELVQEESESEQLDAIEQALGRMETLIEDLLTLAHEGDRVQEPKSIDLSTLAENCWQNVETGEATIETNTDRTIRADEGQLKQLLENLIRNAVQHGGDGVTVTVGDIEDGFYVADDGPGIPEDEREEVFEAGYSTTVDGTGFGLNIVQEIAEAHGWEISLTASESGGARFEVARVEAAA